MKSTQSHLVKTSAKGLLMAALLVATAQFASAQTTTWTGAANDEIWETAGNWSTSGGSTPPGLTDGVVFPNITYPASVDGFNTIITNNVTIGSLSYVNVSPNTVTAYITNGATLTVNGPFTEGVASSTTVLTMSGDGNFTVNNSSGTFSVGGSGSSTETVTLTLDDGTNTFNLKLFSLGESASNNGRSCNLNMGNGPSTFNSDTLNFGTGKASGFVQWPGTATNGNMVIRDHTGAGRATMLLGNGTSGSGGSKGTINATGHPVDILASTITLGRLGNTSGGQTGTLIYDLGNVDATSILMGVIPSSGVGTGSANGNTLTVGGNPTNTAALTVNAAGGGSFILSDSVNAARVASATFSLLTNGTANIFCSITKAQAAENTATLNISGTLNMEAATNTIGTRAVPIDNVTLDFGTLDLAQNGSAVNIAAINLNINDTNTVNFSALPPIIHIPTSIPIISYQALASPVNLGVGTLPGDYTGHLSDDGAGTISLVIDSGTVVVAKQDIWTGAINTNWDTTTFNWTNATLTATNYTEADFVTFDDTALTGNVTLTSQHIPSSVTANNNTLNYVLSGPGRISGSANLVKSGTASFTLADNGGDNFSGGILVHAGTLVLDNPNSNLASGITNDSGSTVQIGNNDNNGALPGGIVEINGTLVFNQTGNHTISSVISGAGTVIQNGSNTVTLTGANTYTGNTIVSKGALTISGAGTIASPVLAVQNATLNINAAITATFNAVTLTNGILNIGAATNSPAFTSFSISNSTINLTANYANAGSTTAMLSGGALTTGGTTNFINISSIQNLPLSPTVPFDIPLIGYSSASFSGGFNIGWTNLPGITGYITNNTANNSIDLIVTNAPQNLTWNGGSATDSNWSDAANWNNIALTPLDALTFDGLLRTNNINDSAPGTTYVGITFNNSAGDAPFTLNGNPINLTGEIVNNAATVQTVKLGLLVNNTITNDGGPENGTLIIAGGVTNTTASAQTIALLDNGTIGDLWSTNNGTNGGGQLNFQAGNGSSDGFWTILDGTGTNGLVSGGNIQLSVNSATEGSGSVLNFGSSNNTPNLDAGFPSNGVVTINGPGTGTSSGTFNMNSGLLKANAVNLGNGGTAIANFNMNGGTIILGPGSLSAAGGNGATVVNIVVTNGAIYSTNGGTFTLAQRGLGTLSMSNGLIQCGTFSLTSGTAASGNGFLNLDGGRLICTNVSVGSSSGNGSGTINFNGGVFQPGASTTVLFKQNNLVPLTNNVQAAGAIIDTAGFNDTFNWPLQTDPTLAASLLPDGGLSKIGAGTLTMSSPNTFTGPTLVGGGTLLLNGVQGPSAVTVLNSATLGGSGVLGSNLTVNAGGTLAPGNAGVGTLTVAGDVALNGTTTMEINKTNSSNDLLLATNATPSTITYGGTLNISVVAGTLAVNDSFQLFSATNYAGSFTSITPATPGAGLAWNTANLAVNGTLSVVAGAGGPTTNVTILKVSLSGTNMLIHGTNNNNPNNAGHFVVLGSTNLSLPLANWTPLSTNIYNSTGTLDYTNPIAPGAPLQFIEIKAIQ